MGLTLSIYVFVLALGQLVGGPLSDRFGRRPILLIGLAGFIAGSFAVAAAESLQAMLAWRATQAFGGGWVAVSVPAIVRDRTSGVETARLFSLIALIMFLAPAIAPTLGSFILALGSWHGIFYFLAGYAVLVGVLLQLFLFRHLTPHERKKEPLHALITNYRHVLGHGTAMQLVILQALNFGVLMLYLTHAPFLLQEWLGLGNSGFSTVFAANVIAMACVALLNRRLLGRFAPRQILAVAFPLQLLAVALLLAVTLLPVPRWLLLPALMMIVASAGATSPNVQASVMQFFRALGGTAAALLGAVQFAGGGLISGASALLVNGHAPRVAASMLVCSLLAVLLTIPATARLRHHHGEPEPGL